MKLGGLFSGIGGFELAWTRLGHEVAWMCEVDRNARKVLEARFPGVPIYPDVQELDPAEVEAVDVLTGGSPCQGFSVAGHRTGLLHGESRLFADYVRIMDGLAERGLQYALWENVPGVLSIKNPDGERTFPHVIGALAGGSTAVRLDPRRKWNVGVATGAGRAVAWRVLDSRYFGVAQRRRRVFACVAFGDSAADRAGRALLAVAEGVRRDSAESVEAGEGAAGGVAGRAGGSGGVHPPLKARDYKGLNHESVRDGAALIDIPDRAGVPSVARTLKARADGSWTADGHGNEVVVDEPTWWDGGDIADSLTTTSDAQRMPDKQRLQAVMDVSATVTSKWAKGSGGPAGSETGNLVTDTPKMLFVRGGVERDSAGKKAKKGALLTDDEAATLDAGNHWTLFQPHAYRMTAIGEYADDDTASTLKAIDYKEAKDLVAPKAFNWQQGDAGYSLRDDTTAFASDSRPGVMIPQAFRKSRRPQSSSDVETWVDDGEANTLNVFDSGDTRTTHAVVEPQEVDSLTPWPEMGEAMRVYGESGPSPSLKMHSPNVMVSYGVRRLTPVECERLQAFPDGWTEPAGSDSARYKALGNAVTVNTVGWILRRMVEA